MADLSFTRARRDAVSNGLLLGSIETPALVMRTYMGNLLFSPPSLADEAIAGNTGPIIGQLELADIVSKDYGDSSLHDLQRNIVSPQGGETPSATGSQANKYTGAHTPQATKLGHAPLKTHTGTGAGLIHLISGRSLRDGVPPLCSDTGISISTPGGRRTISSAAYAQRIALDRPQLVVSLADEFPLTCTSKNRITRCEARTAKMLQELVEASAQSAQAPFFLFGVALGGQQEDSLAHNAKAVLAAGAQGVCVGSVNQPTTATAADTEETFISHVRAVREATLLDPATATAAVPVLVPGCDSLRTMLLALEQGADLVSSSLPSLLTAVGRAVAIDWAFINSQVQDKPRSNSTAGSQEEHAPKRRRVEGAAPRPALLDLWDDVYTADPAAMLGKRGAGNAVCPCHACRHHSRAYIHHLLQAKELLSEVLLYGHNQAQLLEMFKQARQHAAQGMYVCLSGFLKIRSRILFHSC